MINWKEKFFGDLSIKEIFLELPVDLKEFKVKMDMVFIEIMRELENKTEPELEKELKRFQKLEKEAYRCKSMSFFSKRALLLSAYFNKIVVEINELLKKFKDRNLINNC